MLEGDRGGLLKEVDAASVVGPNFTLHPERSNATLIYRS